MLVKKDTLLVLETGEYSDYTFHGPFRVIKDYDEAEVIEGYKKGFIPEYEGDDSPDPHGFGGWMIAQGYLELLEHLSWHVGSYGTFEAKPNTQP